MPRAPALCVSVFLACAGLGGAALAQEDAPVPVGHDKASFMAAYDTDGDGVVTRAEFDAERHKGFIARDADGDGAVTLAEYEAEFLARITHMDEEERVRQIRAAQNRFESLDGDKDGALSPAEFAESGAFMFKSLDSTGDGVVNDSDEARAY